jgi:hypothetical protein
MEDEVTRTSVAAIRVPGGVLQVIWVPAGFATTSVASMLSTETVTVPLKLEPLITIGVPPARGPPAGVTVVIPGVVL